MTGRFEALVALADRLGISADDLRESEGPERLAGTFDIAAEAVSELDEMVLDAVLAQLGSAISLSIGVGDLVDFATSDGSYDIASLNALRSQASRARGSYRVVLQLDKGVVAASLRPAAAGPVLCYVFTSELDRALATAPKDVQHVLWRDARQPLTIFVLDSDVQFVGDWLRIAGAAGADFEPREPTYPVDLDEVTSHRSAYVGWDSMLETSLTPFHFSGERRSGSSVLPQRVASIAAALSVLYLADRARVVTRPDGTEFTQVEFRGREHVAHVPIDWTGPSLDLDETQKRAMVEIVAWCYQPSEGQASRSSPAERLPFVQTRLAQVLESRDESTRLVAICRDMPAVAEGVQWQWRSYVEGRVTEYLDQVRDLEDVVSGAVERVTDNTAGLVKRVTETALAAVAALVGVFIGAALKDPFQVRLFRAAMSAYAAYVLVFPMAIGILAARGDVKAVQAALASRMSQIQQVLGRDRVTEVVGTRAKDAQSRFDRWCLLVAGLYLIAAAAALAAVRYVPDLVIAPTTNP